MMAISDRKDDYHFIRWAQEVKRRDHWTCQVCGRRGVELNSHHLLSWIDNIEDRYDVENGVTLCAGVVKGGISCHELFHQIYGKGNNTPTQFEEFKQIYETMILIANNECMKERVTKDAMRFLDGYMIAEKVLMELGDGYGLLEE